MDEESLFEEEEKGNRKRTQSEYIPRREGLTRVFSESDLTRIDRHATFASATAIRPSELLRQVVGAMEGQTYYFIGIGLSNLYFVSLFLGSGLS